MPLAPGTRIGVYEIVAPIGAGGMGEVFRARDTRLGRDVALKILPADFAGDRSRRDRFEQEARHVATLSHPNIVTLFHVGAEGDVAFMATELIDGESLRGVSLSQRKAIEIAAQIADGLAAAHAAGVTHRDLKPENVMVTRDGRAKILDFGIAKAARAGGDHDVTVGHTDAGMVVGTAGYMAPEQVRGAAVDHRADIFAFGALLFELLSGRRAFVGETSAETMTAVLKQEPPDLPLSVPAPVRQIVRRCLEKQPDERFQSARDLAFALRQAAGDTSATAPSISVTPRRRPGIWAIAATGLVVGGVLVGAAATLRWNNSVDAGIDPIRLTRFSSDPVGEGAPAFSPDGRTIAYRRIGGASTKIMAQALDASSPVILVDSSTALNAPVWTADGRRVCYSNVERDVMCVSAAGGTPQRVLGDASLPRFTPDGKSLLFVRAADGAPWIFVTTPPGAEPTRRTDLPLPPDFVDFIPSPDGMKALVLTGSTLSVKSLSNGLTTPVALAAGTEPWEAAWFPDNRHLALVERTRSPAAFQLVLADTETPARRLVHRDSEGLYSVALSPDGARIAFESGRTELDIHEYSMTGSHTRRVATSADIEGFPAWAPRGDRFLFVVGGPGRPDALWTAAAPGGEASRLLALDTAGLPTTYRFSPDAGRIAYASATGIQTVSSSGGVPIMVTPSRFSATAACWSPDGEWVWYSDGTPPTLRKVPSHGGDPVSVRAEVGRVLDCSPDGRWISALGRNGFTLVSTDGKEERVIAPITSYPSRSHNTMQFGEAGRVLYMLEFNRRSITVLDIATGKPRRTVTFQIPPDQIIEGFAVHPDQTRVLLTIGMYPSDIWIAEGFAQPTTGWRAWLRHWQ